MLFGMVTTEIVVIASEMLDNSNKEEKLTAIQDVQNVFANLDI